MLIFNHNRRLFPEVYTDPISHDEFTIKELSNSNGVIDGVEGADDAAEGF